MTSSMMPCSEKMQLGSENSKISIVRAEPSRIQLQMKAQVCLLMCFHGWKVGQRTMNIALL